MKSQTVGAAGGETTAKTGKNNPHVQQRRCSACVTLAADLCSNSNKGRMERPYRDVIRRAAKVRDQLKILPADTPVKVRCAASSVSNLIALIVLQLQHSTALAYR